MIFATYISYLDKKSGKTVQSNMFVSAIDSFKAYEKAWAFYHNETIVDILVVPVSLNDFLVVDDIDAFNIFIKHIINTIDRR